MTEERFAELLGEVLQEAGGAEPRVGMERRVMARVRLEGRHARRLAAWGVASVGVVLGMAMVWGVEVRGGRETAAPVAGPARASVEPPPELDRPESGAEARVKRRWLRAVRTRPVRGEPMLIPPLVVEDLSIEPLRVE